MPLTLRWRAAAVLPVSGEGLRADLLSGISAAEVARQPIHAGNARAELGDLFAVEGDLADGQLVLEGDLGHVDRIGEGMNSGTLTVRGAAGAELGAGMTGGRIVVEGTVGDWAGAGMRGGLLQVRGVAGRFLGAAYPGARLGMREGVILVEGSIGDDAGLAMRRGLIAVTGAVGGGLGHGMIAGSILAFGAVGPRPGAGMKRGTLAFLGQDVPSLLPTFAPSGRSRPPFLNLYLRRLAQWGFPVPDDAFSRPLERYNGDLAERGQGEIWVGPP